MTHKPFRYRRYMTDTDAKRLVRRIMNDRFGPLAIPGSPWGYVSLHRDAIEYAISRALTGRRYDKKKFTFEWPKP